MSARWWQWLILDPKGAGVVRAADAALEADMIRWVGWPEDDKQRTTSLLVELLCRVMPDYRLDFQFYTQFVVFVGRQSKIQLVELSAHLNGIASAARGQDEALRMVADTLQSYIAMFTIETRSAFVNRLRNQIFSNRSRSTNDLVQSYLAVKLNDMIARYEPT